MGCGKWSPHESWYHYPDEQDYATDEVKVISEELEKA